jgi:uncharacterized membrane protein
LSKIRIFKNEARGFFRKNYFTCVLVSLIMAFFIGTPAAISENMNINTDFLHNVARESGNEGLIRYSERLAELQQNVIDATSIGEKASSGVIAGVYHETMKSGSVGLALLNNINNLFFKGQIGNGVIGFVGTLISVLAYIFIQGILQIGICRFYLENRICADTGISRVLFIYKIRRMLRAGGAVAWRSLWLVIWGFTLVALPVKYYSYYLVNYIIAENPDIGARESLRLSIILMRGSKFKAFLLDLSFIGWYALSLLSFGLLRYLYLEPYIGAARAEFYTYIRLGGDYCDGSVASVQLLHIREDKGRVWINADYGARYPLTNLILLFMVFSFIGWLWECGVAFIQFGMFINRGAFYGPWIPIYGIGGTLALLLFRRILHKPVLSFLLVSIFCGLLEYAAAWALDALWGKSYWDYSGYFFNIQGRVCLEGLLVFSVACMGSLYVLSPLINSLLEKIRPSSCRIICVLVAALFLADMAYALTHPRSGEGITSHYEPPSSIGRISACEITE